MRCVLLTAVVLVASSLSASAQRKVAFLVGVGQYNHFSASKQLGTLPVKDVTALKALLDADGYTCIVLTDKDATRDAVLARYRLALNGQTTANDPKKPLGFQDQLLVFFSGHGIQANAVDPEDPAKAKKNQPFFCVHDSMATRISTLIGFNTLIREAEDHKVRSMFLVDACREVVGEEHFEAEKDGIDGSGVTLKKGTSILYSCSEDERSGQNLLIGHGYFTYAILQTLRGETGKSGELSWDDLVTDVKSSFRRGNLKAKIGDRKQNPRSSGGEETYTSLLTVKAVDRGLRPGEERALDIGNGLKMVFCYIPSGECQLGSPKAERDEVMKQLVDEKRANDGEVPVWLESEAEGVRGKFQTKGFWMAKYTVTQEEWIAVMGNNPSYFAKTGEGKAKVDGLDTSRFPIENVSWDQCQDFLNVLNARVATAKIFGKAGKLVLPHEDQWEYACRGGRGNRRPFYWGDSLNGDKANSDGNYRFGTMAKGTYKERPTPVGSYEMVAPHPWGLCDMSGNVYNWCDNLYSNDSKSRVLRGGSWSSRCRNCRAANRDWLVPDLNTLNFGCRLVPLMD